MSHIFDALQRSEAERTGFELQPVSVATDLLQVIETESVAERLTGLRPEPTHGTKIAEERLPIAVQTLPEVTKAPVAPVAAEPVNEECSDQFSQFQSLRVLVPPQSRLVCITDKESLAAEKFRYLAVRLRQLQQSRPLKKVLITSAIPREGKTMVAANLACSLARRAQKTLLVEGDLRRPALAQMFGLSKISGICEWLQGESGPSASIYHLEGPGFWILPAGSTPRNPLELMQSGKLSHLMEQLTGWFDWVVIDSPPVLPLGDTSVWARLADGILLVTRQGTTEKRQLQRGIEALESKKLIGALLNSSVSTAHSDYDYHYGASSQPGREAQPK